MTNKEFARITYVVIFFYLFFIAFGFYIFRERRYYFDFYKEVMPLLFGIPGAYYGFAFQRRSSYLQALRDFWAVLIPAVQRAIKFTYMKKFDDIEYCSVMADLSTAVDFLRGVFKNIPNGNLYPYEPLKDIIEVMRWINSHKSMEERRLARLSISSLWREVHWKMLLEFDRAIPTFPVSKYLDREKSVADKLKDGTLDFEYFDKKKYR